MNLIFRWWFCLAGYLLVWGVHLEIPADEELARHDGCLNISAGLQLGFLHLITGN